MSRAAKDKESRLPGVGIELISESWLKELNRAAEVAKNDHMESWRKHSAALVKLSAAISTASVLTVGMVMVDFAMVGRLGATELGAVALGTTWFNLVNHAMSGAATSLDTLFAQSFGAKQFDRYGDFLRAGLCALCGLCVPCAIILALCEPILVRINTFFSRSYYLYNCFPAVNQKLVKLTYFHTFQCRLLCGLLLRWRWGKIRCWRPWQGAIA